MYCVMESAWYGMAVTKALGRRYSAEHSKTNQALMFNNDARKYGGLGRNPWSLFAYSRKIIYFQFTYSQWGRIDSNTITKHQLWTKRCNRSACRWENLRSDSVIEMPIYTEPIAYRETWSTFRNAHIGLRFRYFAHWRHLVGKSTDAIKTSPIIDRVQKWHCNTSILAI